MIQPTMFDEVVEVAEFGVVPAQLALFLLYANGWGVEADPKTASEYLKKATAGDDPVVQYFAGSYFASRAAKQQNVAAAFNWYRQSADQGFPPAQQMVSACYQFGQGTSIDPVKALEWGLKAAHAGFIPAQVSVGSMYGEGIGTTKDPAESFRWYLEAAKQGSAEGACAVAGMYELGEGTARDESTALNWYRESAKRGSWIASSTLASVYRLGRLGVRKDPDLAEGYEQSAERLKAQIARKLAPQQFPDGDGKDCT